MEFPAELRLAIEERAAGMAPGRLAAAARGLSERYRTAEGNGVSRVAGEEDALAYAAARMPATFGAAREVLGRLAGMMPPGEEIRTLLDVGAGTGAVTWAAASLFDLRRAVCLEREACMRQLGQALCGCADESALRDSTWAPFDLDTDPLNHRADLVVAGYMLNEFREERRGPALGKLWQAAERYLVLLEPGTPEGYRLMLAERDILLREGAFLLAPCPHSGPCPLQSPDRCHFSCRVSRSRLHRMLKGGEAPYEDEKFTYLIFSRTPGTPTGRIIRHPTVEPGRVTLSLCTPNGLAARVVRKKDPLFRAARKAAWGDAWQEEAPDEGHSACRDGRPE